MQTPLHVTLVLFWRGCGLPPRKMVLYFGGAGDSGGGRVGRSVEPAHLIVELSGVADAQRTLAARQLRAEGKGDGAQCVVENGGGRRAWLKIVDNR